MQRNERGQALPLLALVMVVLGAGTMMVGRLGEAAVDRAGAQTAADAAALAGAVDGEAGARRLAAENGGRLLRFERAGADTRVVVEAGGARASARARRAAVGVASGTGATGGLAPAMRAALARAQQLLGVAVPITSGYRSPEKQAELYARRATNRYPVAPPGRSTHEKGLAVDVPMWFVRRLVGVAAQAGLCRPLASTDPVHFEVCGSR